MFHFLSPFLWAVLPPPLGLVLSFIFCTQQNPFHCNIGNYKQWHIPKCGFLYCELVVCPHNHNGYHNISKTLWPLLSFQSNPRKPRLQIQCNTLSFFISLSKYECMFPFGSIYIILIFKEISIDKFHKFTLFLLYTFYIM